MCDLYDHIQKKNDGNGLAEDEARSIFRQVSFALTFFVQSLQQNKTFIFALGLQRYTLLPLTEDCAS